VQEIFHSALERRTGDRWEFLVDACDGNAELRAEVASLLGAHDDAGFLEDLPVGSDESPTPSELIGPYRVVRRIGEGGMGSVYLAERVGPDFTQVVALKLIRGGMVSQMLEERLRAERRILARLEHPGIARLIDGGTTDHGQTYYAMEYVEGTSILRYCDEHDLTVTQRLDLFIEICEAVHYAHTQLVVHRDLKPSNIFVTNEGRPKLLDFGIAKLLDDAQSSPDATPTAPWFTPAYASPEQVRGERVGTLSDLYVLGVLLYEMLTGERPYDLSCSVPTDIAQVISEQRPARPSSRVRGHRDRRALAGDLDTIVLKALAKEPTRRYGSVEQLASDLRRHLDSKPVLARPDSYRYRTSKFVKRHRVGVLAAAVVVLSLIGGFVAASWQATVASQERTRAQLARNRTEGVSDFVIDLFSGDDASVDVQATTTMLEYGVRQAEELAAQPGVQAETYEALARAYYNMARYQEAADLHTRAYDIRAGLFPDGHADVARSLTRMSDAVSRLGLGDSNLRLLERAWEMEQGLSPEADRVRLETLVEYGRVSRGDARYEQSDSILRVALAISDRAVDQDDPLRVSILHQLVMTARRREEFTEAEQLQLEAMAILRRNLGAEHPELAYELFFFGDLLWDGLGELERAEEHYREGLRIVEQALGPESKRLVHGINSLASMLSESGREEEAIALMRRGVQIVERAYGADNIATARERESFASVLLRSGYTDEAEAIFLDVLDHKRVLLGEWTVPSILLNLAGIAQMRGDLAEATRYATEAASIQQETGAPAPTVARTLRRVADLQLARQDYPAAERLLLDALTMAVTPPSRAPEVEASYRALSRLYREWGRPAQAATYLSLARRESVRPASSSR